MALFDSRVVHCGGANTSQGKRRVLFYFTLTAGDTEKYNPNPSRGTGSIRAIDRHKYSYKQLLQLATEKKVKELVVNV
jgi:ectoine hydroxylase-related dioxygenase (phytanoyl-CoA dioxygenase family)